MICARLIFSQTKSALLFLHGDTTKIMWNHDEIFVSYLAFFCPSIVGNNTSLLSFKPQRFSFFTLTKIKQITKPPRAAVRSSLTYSTGTIDLQYIIMAPGAFSTNDAFREFYAPRTTEPPTSNQSQSMPPVEHQRPRKPIEPRNYNSTNRTKSDGEDQREAGCLGEIRNYKAGDEFLLLWKWVDDFIDKRRAKKNSSKSTSHQSKPAPSLSRETQQAPRAAITLSPEAARRQTTSRGNMREYKTQRHTLWGELFNLYTNWKEQQAKKKADQRRREEISRSHWRVTERRDEPARGRSTAQLEHPKATPSPPDQDNSADSQPGVTRKPVPLYTKKRGEVQKHAVKIAQLPPVHNSVHLQHTPSNNYRARPSPARGQKDNLTRNTRFSDFLPLERKPQKPVSSRETQWTYAVPGEDDELVRNNRFSSILDPAKAIKKAKEAERAKGPKCYMCGSKDCPGGYRDNITKLWVCEPCQRTHNMAPTQCSVCGDPTDAGYADNGLWMCTQCRNPTTPKELPPSPRFSRKATSKPKASQPPIPQGVSVPIPEYDSDHLYSEDSYETRATTPPPQRPSGLGITYQDQSEQEENPATPPTPPLKDSKYHRNSPAMDYDQSYLRKPGTKHPYAPSSASTTRNSSISFAPDPRKSKMSQQQHHQQNHFFNPTTYPYPSPLSTPTSLHRPRPASSVYPIDEPSTEFPYPPPPIPQEFVNRPWRSSSASPGTLSRAALARTSTEPVSPVSVSTMESGRKVLNRRSSWYDYWKPILEWTGERSP